MGGSLLPKVVENMLDAKVELDGRLRTVINEFVNQFSARITEPINETAVAKRDFDGMKALLEVQRVSEKEVAILRRKLEEYLDDIRTRETLVAAVQDQTLQNYEMFYAVYTKEKRTSGGRLSKKGKGREDEVWDPDMFSEWSGTVFKVGRSRLGDGESESRSRSMSRSGSI